MIVPGHRLFPTVAVIITCHNYGRFLDEAIKSVLDQTVIPAELLVVDDASSDDTAEVARKYASSGVGYLRVDVRSAFRARAAGLHATQSEVICFLDADDVLPHDYLERGLPLFESPEVGIIYSDIELFGDRSGRQLMPEWDKVEFDRENFMHAGSLVRRIALEIADAFREPDLLEAHEDWLVWRRVVAAGWIGSKQSAIYRYRRHASAGPSRSQSLRWSYFDNGSLRLIDVTIFTALSGRSSLWPAYCDWLLNQTWPREQTRLFLMDTSGNPAFRASVRSFLADSRYADVRCVDRVVAEPGLADRPRGPNSAAVRLACARIYNQMAREVTTPYVLVVEDDIVPPLGVIDRLLHALDRDTAVVGAPYRARGLGHYVAWDENRRTPSRRRGHPDDRRVRFRLRAAPHLHPARRHLQLRILRADRLRPCFLPSDSSRWLDHQDRLVARMRTSRSRNRLMTPTLPSCDYRNRLPDGLACELLGQLAGVADESLLRISDDACRACCSAGSPGPSRLNPVIASLLDRLAANLRPRSEIERAQVANLRELARRHLAVVYGEDRGSAEPRRAHEACYYLGPPLDASTTPAAPPFALACQHPEHRGVPTTRDGCHRCRDWTDRPRSTPQPLVELLAPLPRCGPAVRTWAVGITASSRPTRTLDWTLDSLGRAGWSSVHLFADGDILVAPRHEHVPTTVRRPAAGAWSNYYLSLSELLLRAGRGRFSDGPG